MRKAKCWETSMRHFCGFRVKPLFHISLEMSPYPIFFPSFLDQLLIVNGSWLTSLTYIVKLLECIVSVKHDNSAPLEECFSLTDWCLSPPPVKKNLPSCWHLIWNFHIHILYVDGGNSCASCWLHWGNSVQFRCSQVIQYFHLELLNS